MRSKPAFTPEQDARIRELVGEVITEMMYRRARSDAFDTREAVDFLNQGDPATPTYARRGFYDE